MPDALVVASLTITGEHLAEPESGDPDVLTCAGASFGAHTRESIDVFVCDIVVDRVGVPRLRHAKLGPTTRDPILAVLSLEVWRIVISV